MRTNKRLLELLREELQLLTQHTTVLVQDYETFNLFCQAIETISKMISNLSKTLDKTSLSAYMSQLILLIYPLLRKICELEVEDPELMETSSHLLDELVNQSLSFDELKMVVEEQGYTLEDTMDLEFSLYKKRKDSNSLYDTDDLTPEMLIKKYYYVVNKPRFNMLLNEFKENYIKNECLVEEAHTIEERQGMEEMYDYIIGYDRNQFLNIFHLQELHRKLFSKVPHPEFGGHFRTDFAYIKHVNVSLYRADNIVPEINRLFPIVNEIVKEGKKLGEHKNSEKILPYINRCIELNCHLIRVHPFGDGNGRTVRGFTNLLFSLANIPPIYILVEEKGEYKQAMYRALRENDYTAIKKFYYYKICDSLMELDVKKRIASDMTEKRLYNTKISTHY